MNTKNTSESDDSHDETIRYTHNNASHFMADAGAGAHSTVIDIEFPGGATSSATGGPTGGATGGTPSVEEMMNRLTEMHQTLIASQTEMIETRSHNQALEKRVNDLQAQLSAPLQPTNQFAGYAPTSNPNLEGQLYAWSQYWQPPHMYNQHALGPQQSQQLAWQQHPHQLQPSLTLNVPQRPQHQSHMPETRHMPSSHLLPPPQQPNSWCAPQPPIHVPMSHPHTSVDVQMLRSQPAQHQQASYVQPPRLPHTQNNMEYNEAAHRPIDLPEFDGQAEQWPVFIAAYQQSTQAFGYGSLQNLFRLQKSLKGAAKESVQYLLTDPAHLEEIMDDLEFRFGRPDQLVRCQTAKLKEFKPIDEQQIYRFIDYSSLVQNICAYLNKEASRHVLGETTLMADLVSKLPPSKQLQWAEHSMKLNTRATAVDFSAWLRIVARCVTTLIPTVTTASNNSTTPRAPPTARQHHPSSQNRHVFRVGQTNTTDSTDKSTNQSFEDMTVTERWAVARREKLCFGCLRNGHSFTECRSKRQCNARGCDRMHHTLLHNDYMDQSSSTTFEPETRTERRNPFSGSIDNLSPTAPVLNCRVVDHLPLLFRIIPVKLYGPKSCIVVYALLDEGSSVTMLETDIADELGLNGPVGQLTMQFVGNSTSSESSRVVSLQISGIEDNAQRYHIASVRTKIGLNLPMQSINMSDLDSRFRHLRRLPVNEYKNATPKILIGLEHAYLGMPLAVKTGSLHSPIACKTKLGWVVYGQQGPTAGVKVGNIYHCHETKDKRLDELDSLVRDFYTTESFGVKAAERIIESDDDARARHILERTTMRNGARFQTGLLWKSDTVKFPDSYAMAHRRLSTIIRKMKNDPNYARMYQQEIDKYLKKGYARLLSPSEANTRDNKTWYLPHFGVQNINKPGKFRLVFDAAASVSGISMNTMLLKGPDMNEPMTNILFRFRQGTVGVCGDIAEMFHQVEIQHEDRRSQRFLWVDANKKTIECEMNVMTFGATCSPTSAQFVKNTNADEFANEFPIAAKAIKDSHYVDDYVASYATEAEAIQVTKDVVEIHRRGGFTLRKIISSSRSVGSALNGSASETGSVDMQLDDSAANKILGMRWRTDQDAFHFIINFPNADQEVVQGSRTPTKRELLSVVMSVYDPFGFLCEYMLPAKIMLQELWRMGTGWDDPVPDPINEKWQAWRRGIPSVSNLYIPRCYSRYMFRSANIELHVFADASEEAFATAAFWRIEQNNNFEVVFVAGKTRCAPIKPLTVPRLELQAAVLAARLTSTILNSHQISVGRIVLWSDSQTVLHWIRSQQRRYKSFVAHRVAEITDTVGSSCWRWIPTDMNVADDATRVSKITTFDCNSRWIWGPNFLRATEDTWPCEPAQTNYPKDEEEVRPKFVGITVGQQVIDVSRFSDYTPLCRTMAIILRFAHNSRHGADERRYGQVDATEMKSAEKKLFRMAQMDGFRQEYEALTNGRQISRSSDIVALMPYLDDDGVMRLYGRTDLADARYLTEDAQRPILLPKTHRISELLVRKHHAEMAHQLEDATICAIRQRVWIPHLRTLLRRVKSNCLVCKIRSARPNPPVEGQLPPDRLTPYSPPFTYTGVDFFGPIPVSLSRRREKRWIAIFTCLTTRAVHMELSQDLSSDAFLLCIRNFCNVRGIPTRIRSDCGTNFVGADGEMRKLKDFLDVEEVGRGLTAKGIEWKFNCPANPEAGGAWERLVQSAKRVLQVTLKQVAPQVETLRSMVIEAANIINSRPLTHIPVSPRDLCPITPNHFLLGRANSTTMTVPEEKKQLSSRKQWRVLQQLNNQFWRRWVSDYLPELTRRTKYHEEVGPIAPGSLVLVCDSNMSRNQWIRGRVEEVVVGTDGRVRTALIRTSSGTTRRPVSKLALLDVEVGEPGGARTHGARDVADLDGTDSK